MTLAEHQECKCTVVGLQDMDRFLAAKAKVDGAEGRSDDAAKNDVVEALHALTTLRASLTSGLASGGPPAAVPVPCCNVGVKVR
jgi:hypothetical protein